MDQFDFKKKIETIKYISTVVNSSIDLDDLLQVIMSAACEITNTEASSLLLLDDETHELYFSIVTGDKKEKVKEIRVPVGKGIAGYVAETGKLLLVEDVTKDKRFYKVVDRKTKFHTKSILCVPLKVKQKLVGVLEILNKKDEKKFTENDKELIMVLAHQAAIAIEKAKLYKDSIEKERTDQEIKIAQNLQTKFLEKSFPKIKGYEMTGMSLPARKVGGDFYDCFMMDKDNLLFLIADVAGKGVGAAMLMSVALTYIKAVAVNSRIPIKEIIDKVNHFIINELSTNMFLTLFMMKYNIPSNTAVYSNAGHNPQFILRNNNRISQMNPHSTIVGVFENLKISETKVKFKKGDSLILYTDGIIESVNNKFKQFGERRLRKIIKNNSGLNVYKLKNKIIEKINEFTQEKEQFDDMTLFLFKRLK